MSIHPYPPSDLKTVVDLAVNQQKWFNMVLHNMTNDDGAINYAHSKNIWVTSIGNVIKYILQRDRFILTNYSSSSDLIMFNASRLSIPSSASKNFEAAFDPNDITTLQIDIDDNKNIENVLINGVINPYQIKDISGNDVLLTNIRLEPGITKTVEIKYPGQSLPLISLNPNTLNFSAIRNGTLPSSQSVSITNSGTSDILSWNSTENISWLSVTPQNGTTPGTLAVSVDQSGLDAGTYNGTITISSAGASNSPQVVNVILTVNPEATGNLHYNFTYADRSSLLADGWDFIAVTPSNGSRNTEQTSGAVVSYDQQAHPGVLRIPVDAGYIWGTTPNNTRNTLFRNLPSGWTSIRLKISSFAPTRNYQTAGLAAYQNDDNYVQITRKYAGGNHVIFAREVGGSASSLNSVSVSATTNLHFRLDRDIATGTITSYYSLDGSAWTQVGSIVQSLSNPRLAILVDGDESPGSYPNADFAWAEINTQASTLTAGTIGTAQTICYNTSPAPLTQITAPTGGTGVYTFQWQSSPDNSVWTNISGATLSGYSPPALSASTYYRRTVTSGSYSPVNSSPVLITVSPQVTLAQLHDNISIGNNTSTNFNVVISGGTSPFTINYTRNGVAQSAITNYFSGTNISTGVLTTGVYIYALTSVTDAHGCAAQNLGTNITVTVTDNGNLTAGTIGTAQTICYNTSPAPLTQITAPTGGTGVYTFQWQSSPDNSVWTNISGATLSGYSPPALSASTYYRRTVTSGSYSPVNSSPVLITVSPQVTLAQLTIIFP